MTQCNSLNIKLSNPQLNKLKSTIRNKTDVALRLSSNMIGNSDELLIDKLQIFVRLLLTSYQLILNCRTLSNLR